MIEQHLQRALEEPATLFTLFSATSELVTPDLQDPNRSEPGWSSEPTSQISATSLIQFTWIHVVLWNSVAHTE